LLTTGQPANLPTLNKAGQPATHKTVTKEDDVANTLPNKPLERKLADEQLSRLLILPDLTKGNSSCMSENAMRLICRFADRLKLENA
jgi:hypothetical protein